MSKLSKQSKDEMIEYVEYLLKHAIYCHGLDIKMLAAHLIGNGCRIYVGPKRLKRMNLKKGE